MTQRTKTCQKCGWVYSADYPEIRCKFCGTRFKYDLCLGCNEVKHVRYGRFCTTCHSKRVKASTTEEQARVKMVNYTLKKRTTAENALQAWLDLTIKIPFKSLTEDAWIRACTHFKGCALCNSESIDARAFFIAYAIGGRYTAWNVIPVCAACSKPKCRSVNPFASHKERAAIIVAYLKQEVPE